MLGMKNALEVDTHGRHKPQTRCPLMRLAKARSLKYLSFLLLSTFFATIAAQFFAILSLAYSLNQLCLIVSSLGKCCSRHFDQHPQNVAHPVGPQNSKYQVPVAPVQLGLHSLCRARCGHLRIQFCADVLAVGIVAESVFPFFLVLCHQRGRHLAGLRPRR